MNTRTTLGTRSERGRISIDPRSRMGMAGRWIAAAAGAAVLALTMGIADADAQESPWTVEARGGVAIPVDDLNDFLDPGGTVGIGASYQLNPRLALRVDGDLALLQGDDAPDGASLPDMDIWHLGGGIEGQITSPVSPWNITANVGAGASILDSDSFAQPVVNPVTGETADGFTETYFSANGGITVGYELSPQFSVVGGGQAYLIVTDDDDTAIFGQLTPEADPEGFDTAWNFPLHAGFRIHF